MTTFPCARSTTCGSSSATPGSRRIFYRNAFGFDVVAYAGLETRVKHEAGYVLRQGEITFVLDLAAVERAPRKPAAHHARRRRAGHRPGGATTCRPPSTRPCRRGAMPRDAADARSRTSTASTSTPRSAPTATRRTPSSTATAIAASSPRASSRIDPERYSPSTFQPVGLEAIDHIVGNVEEGKMDEWVEFYEQGPRLQPARPLRRQGHQHRVLGADVEGGAERHGPDQVPDQRAGPGQAARRRSRSTCSSTAARACSTSRWRPATSSKTVRAMRANDVSFLRVPQDLLRHAARARRRRSRRTCDELAELGILVDRDDEGYMLQIFTKPVEDRPTLFFEVIQRRGSQELRQGELQGAVRGDRARAGAARNAMTALSKAINA